MVATLPGPSYILFFLVVRDCGFLEGTLRWLEPWLPSGDVHKAKFTGCIFPGPDGIVGRSGLHVLGNDCLVADIGKAGML